MIRFHGLILGVASSLALALPRPAAAESAPDSLPMRVPEALRAPDAGIAPQAPASAAPVRRDSVRAEPEGPVDYLWVLRGSLRDRASVDSVVARAQRLGVRGLLAQVVGRGDACYRSDILPRAEFLPVARDSDGAPFDPLAELIEQAHRSGLEVHAWVNCLLVWSAPQPPRDPRHVVNAHPEWIASLRDGRRMTALKPGARQRLGVEGVFLSPAHPAVRAWIGSIAREIASRYAVDGIHLDYIRDPSIEVGYDPTTRSRFAMDSGVDPARIDDLSSAERIRVEAMWQDFNRAQVTAVVQAVRDSLRDLGRPVQLSAAVVADTVRAERANAQSWRAWVRDGLLDRAFLMCYAASIQTVMDQMARFADELGANERVVPGIAMFNTAPLTAAFKIKGARALGFPSVALYSYDSLFGAHGYWDALRSQLEPALEGNR